MSTRLRDVLARQWEKATDLGVPGLLAALVGISQVVLHHMSSDERVAAGLLIASLMLASSRRWVRRTAARAAVRDHLARMQPPVMRRTAR